MTVCKKFVSVLIAAISFCALTAASAHGDSLSDRTDLKNDIGRLFGREKFAELEAMRAKFHKEKLRNASGRWQLTVFENAFLWEFRDHRKKYGDNTFWDKTEQKVKRWVAAYPNSPAPHLAYARFLFNRGWDFNNEQPMRKQTKPENMERFLKFAGQARNYLETVKTIAADDPNWYRLMVEIARWQKWPEAEFRKLTDEAFGKEPLFYRTYLAAASYYHVPETESGAAALEAFAQRALRRTEALEGAAIYARIYWHIAETDLGERLFLDSGADWKTMEQGISDIMASYPDNWNAHNFARLACLAGDIQKTSDLFTHVKGRQSRSALKMAWGRLSLLGECGQQVAAKPPALKEYVRDFVRFMMQ